MGVPWYYQANVLLFHKPTRPLMINDTDRDRQRMVSVWSGQKQFDKTVVNPVESCQLSKNRSDQEVLGQILLFQPSVVLFFQHFRTK